MSVLERRFRRNEKQAISPLIATLILIAITIVGGIVVYRLFLNTSGILSQNLHATIGDVSLSESTLTVSVKNDETFPWSIASVKVNGATATLTGQPNIDPGKSAGMVFSIPGEIDAPSDGILVGTAYTVSVTVTNTTGGTFVTSASVYATAG